MRRLKELKKDSRARLARYIAQWPTLTTKELAYDLHLRVTTVAAVRAHLTRRTKEDLKEFGVFK